MPKVGNSAKVVIVIPCHNEARHLKNLFKSIKNNCSLQIVLVDDGSTDETFMLASSLTPFVLRHQINLGKGAALRTGCDFAFHHLQADWVIMMDADEQHSAKDLQLFTEAISQNHGLILGVRSFRGMPYGAVIANKLSSFLLRVLYRQYIPDIPSGYKAISYSVYQQILWPGSGYEVEFEIARAVVHKKIPYQVVKIRTIYPKYVRGMTFLDGLKVFFKMFGIK